MKYTVKRSSIATLLNVVREDGFAWSAIWMGDSPMRFDRAEWPRLDVSPRPMIPQIVINHCATHFKGMFAIPVEEREARVQATQPVEFEVEES